MRLAAGRPVEATAALDRAERFLDTYGQRSVPCKAPRVKGRQSMLYTGNQQLAAVITLF
jgi:hypothetical protein